MLCSALLLSSAAGAAGDTSSIRQPHTSTVDRVKTVATPLAQPLLQGVATIPSRATDSSYLDPAGDATGGAPDVTSVQVVNDAASTITFTVAVGGVPAPETFVDLWLNVDRNPSTGDQGVEFNLFLTGVDVRTFGARWDGLAWVDWSPPSARAGFAAGIWTLAINRADLNGTGAFDFYFISSKFAGQQEFGRDEAPNGTAVYTYTLTQGPAPPPSPPPPRPEPKTYLDAPRLSSRIKYVGKSIKHVRLGEKLYETMKRLGSPRVVAVACWSKSDWPPVLASAGGLGEPGIVTAGFFRSDQPRWLHIAPKQCSDVQGLINTRQPNGQRAYALATVLHERVHAQVDVSEAQTNCYGVQLVYWWARELNFVDRLALRLEQLAVRKARAVAPRGYWDSARCRDGGRWDIFPEYRNLDY